MRRGRADGRGKPEFGGARCRASGHGLPRGQKTPLRKTANHIQTKLNFAQDGYVSMWLRIILALTVLVGLHVYLGFRLLQVGWLGEPAFFASWFLLLGSISLHPLSFLARRSPDTALRAQLFGWASYLTLGALALLFTLVVLRDVVALLSFLLGALYCSIDAAPNCMAEWPSFSGHWEQTSVAIVVLSGVLGCWGFREAWRVPRVREVDIPLPGLPRALWDFRIVQLSDVHIGPTLRRRFLSRVVAEVNRLQADAVAITGDLVDGPVASLADQVEVLRELQSRHGTFFVTGNHEYYAGALPWVKALRDWGIDVLENEHRVLQHDGAALVMAGVCDFNAGDFVPAHTHDPHKAMRGCPAEPPKILLAHQPRSVTQAEDAGFDVQLSGHTHGGQFVPWNFFVPLQQPVVAGLHRVGRLWLYTSRGTGHWGPPLRLFAPSEITLLRLRSTSVAET